MLHGGLSNLGLDPGVYDAVVSLDTLYYVTDPLDELERMRQLVRPGGHLVLRLRNGLWTLRKARREGAKPIGRAVLPSEHLWAWTPATLAVLLPKVGLELRWVEPAAYSATIGAVFRAMLVGLNRSVLQIGVPILTQSFTAIARRNG
jgi:SAM-dependent methyltransferase